MKSVVQMCVSMWVALILTACSGGGDAPFLVYPALPPQRPIHAAQAPIVALDGFLHVGADVVVPDEQLPPTTTHGDTDLFYGSVRDGVGAAEVIAYLQADAVGYPIADGEDNGDVQLLPDGLFLRFETAPPTVRVAEGTAPELIDETVRVVQLINAALPQAWQLQFSRGPGPAGMLGAPDGEILIEFAAQEDWSHPDTPPPSEEIHIGLAQPFYRIVPPGDPEEPWKVEIIAGQVWVDPTRTRGQERLGVIAHELLHLLGRNHVDPARFPQTVMLGGDGGGPSEHVLHPLDREALLAVYGRFGPGIAPDSIAETLGSWSDTSLHVRGVLGMADGEIAFGAALRNGLSQPWAFGPAPHANLEANPMLSESVSWSGRLLGLTPQAEVVAGAAGLTIELATLAGRMDFTRLESWAAHAAPGAIGTGTIWGDGDLSYGIDVRGNSFVQTGGDAGILTGVFFGASHEGMGGVLERDDLSAGFGGNR